MIMAKTPFSFLDQLDSREAFREPERVIIV